MSNYKPLLDWYRGKKETDDHSSLSLNSELISFMLKGGFCYSY